MDVLKYYYNFGDPGVENELLDFQQFSNELESFKVAQQEKDLAKQQPVVSVWLKDTNINGITMLSAFYDLRRGIFTKKIKTDEFFVAAHKTEDSGIQTEYFWGTKDYEEFKNLFYQFVVNQKTPDLATWSKNIF